MRFSTKTTTTTSATTFFQALLAALALLTAGCHKGAETNVTPLEKAFGPKSAGATPEQQQVQDLVSTATEAARDNDFTKAVASLTLLRNQPSLTPAQQAAVQDTMGNIQSELARRAEAGDANAIKSLEEYRMMKKR